MKVKAKKHHQSLFPTLHELTQALISKKILSYRLKIPQWDPRKWGKPPVLRKRKWIFWLKRRIVDLRNSSIEMRLLRELVEPLSFRMTRRMQHKDRWLLSEYLAEDSNWKSSRLLKPKRNWLKSSRIKIKPLFKRIHLLRLPWMMQTPMHQIVYHSLIKKGKQRAGRLQLTFENRRVRSPQNNKSSSPRSSWLGRMLLITEIRKWGTSWSEEIQPQGSQMSSLS